MKIPFHIVSGFLGSGKTTFLKKLIDKYAGVMKLGIIQNEFAQSNIDAAELKSTGNKFALLEINKGSAFCVCLFGDFTRSLEQFIQEYQPEALVLEASGLSDTTSVAEILSTGNLADLIYLATNWCIVDSANFSKAGLMKQRVMHQIRMADTILLNKTDLTKNITHVEEAVRKLNPYAEIKKTVYCDTDFMLGSDPVSRFYPYPVQPLGKPDIHSMVIKSGRKLSYENAMDFLQQWAPKAYRIKGYLNLKNGNTLAVQCVSDNINTQEMAGSLHPSEIIALSDQFGLKEWNSSFKQIAGNGKR